MADRQLLLLLVAAVDLMEALLLLVDNQKESVITQLTECEFVISRFLNVCLDNSLETDVSRQ